MKIKSFFVAVERMPKKKRKSTDGANSRVQDHEEESRGESDAKLKRSFGDAFIVISDSDGEVSGQEHSPSWETLFMCHSNSTGESLSSTFLFRIR